MTSQSDNCQTNEDSNILFPIAIESLRFPLDSTMRIIFTGYYNGFNVEVRSPEEMAMLHHMGCFGKGTLSRSKPKVSQSDSSCFMRKRQYLKRSDWYKKFFQNIGNFDSFFKESDELIADIIKESKKMKKKDVIDLVSSDEECVMSDNAQTVDHPILLDATNKHNLVVIVPDSDTDEENYFHKFKPECCINKVNIQEKLMLTLEEAFFLSYGLGSLQVLNSEEKIYNTDQLWDLFIKTDKNFIKKYVVYHYYRSKGYIVKCGIKFGGNYLLYKESPVTAHGDYIVVIKEDREMLDWVSILAHIRMATTTAKEVLVAEVIKHGEGIPLTFENLHTFSVKEIVISKKNQFSMSNDDVTDR